jgi:hypothetical protein
LRRWRETGGKRDLGTLAITPMDGEIHNAYEKHIPKYTKYNERKKQKRKEENAEKESEQQERHTAHTQKHTITDLAGITHAL